MDVALSLSSRGPRFHHHSALLQRSMRARHAAHAHVLKALPDCLSQEGYLVPADSKPPALKRNPVDKAL